MSNGDMGLYGRHITSVSSLAWPRGCSREWPRTERWDWCSGRYKCLDLRQLYRSSWSEEESGSPSQPEDSRGLLPHRSVSPQVWTLSSVRVNKEHNPLLYPPLSPKGAGTTGTVPPATGFTGTSQLHSTEPHSSSGWTGGSGRLLKVLNTHTHTPYTDMYLCIRASLTYKCMLVYQIFVYSSPI